MKGPPSVAHRFLRTMLPMVLGPLIIVSGLAVYYELREARGKGEAYIKQRERDIITLAENPSIANYHYNRFFGLNEEAEVYRSEVARSFSGFLRRYNVSEIVYRSLRFIEPDGRTPITVTGPTGGQMLPYEGDTLKSVLTYTHGTVLTSPPGDVMFSATPVYYDYNTNMKFESDELIGVVVAEYNFPSLLFSSLYRKILFYSLGMIIMAVIFTVVIVVQNVKSLVWPVRELAWATDAIAAGKLEVTVQDGRADELGQLALAFNKMAGSLRTAALERKAHLEEVTELNKELRVVLEQRTQEKKQLEDLLTQTRSLQEQLIQSSKLAALGGLASGIAHEFNNILAGMMGHSENALDNRDVEEKDRALNIVLDACERGQHITANLLTFARRQELKKEISDLNLVLDNVVILTQRELEKCNIKVIRRCESIPRVLCDQAQIGQVFLNLITNARDAMAGKGGELIISSGYSEGYVEFKFMDTGPGIPAEIRDRIFEPFVTTKYRDSGGARQGTGLGLAVSYGIVKSHQGEIKASSLPGVGTIFSVRLPARGNEEEHLFEKATAGSISSRQFLKGFRILVVDDEPVICDALQNKLTRLSCHVVCALDGLTALQALETQHFDLVLCDITMPGMDGLDLLREIRAKGRDIKVLMITGQIVGEDLEKAINLGSDGYLRKPFSLNELEAALSNCLRQEGQI